MELKIWISLLRSNFFYYQVIREHKWGLAYCSSVMEKCKTGCIHAMGRASYCIANCACISKRMVIFWKSIPSLALIASSLIEFDIIDLYIGTMLPLSISRINNASPAHSSLSVSNKIKIEAPTFFARTTEIRKMFLFIEWFYVALIP